MTVRSSVIYVQTHKTSDFYRDKVLFIYLTVKHMYVVALQTV